MEEILTLEFLFCQWFVFCLNKTHAKFCNKNSNRSLKVSSVLTTRCPKMQELIILLNLLLLGLDYYIFLPLLKNIWCMYSISNVYQPLSQYSLSPRPYPFETLLHVSSITLPTTSTCLFLTALHILTLSLKHPAISSFIYAHKTYFLLISFL